MENPLQSAMLEAVATRIRNRENPENAAMTEVVVQDFRLDVGRGVATELRANVALRIEALAPAGRTLSVEEEKKINDTYDDIEAIFKNVVKPIRQR